MKAPRRASSRQSARAERVKIIVDLMTRGEWSTKKAKELAEQWRDGRGADRGISLTAVQHYSGEASRYVRAAMGDPEEIRTNTLAYLEELQQRALAPLCMHCERGGDLRVGVAAAKVIADIVGLAAPQKHEHDVRVSEVLALPPDQVRARLKQHVAKHMELYEELLEEVKGEQARQASAIVSSAQGGSADGPPRGLLPTRSGGDGYDS